MKEKDIIDKKNNTNLVNFKSKRMELQKKTLQSRFSKLNNEDKTKNVNTVVNIEKKNNNFRNFNFKDNNFKNKFNNNLQERNNIKEDKSNINFEETQNQTFKQMMSGEVNFKKKEFTLKVVDLFEHGVQFGHDTSYTNFFMKKYVYSYIKKTCIINLDETIEKLKEVCEFIESKVSKGARILWVGTGSNSRNIIKKCAFNSGSFYVNYKWKAGLLTNFKETLNTQNKLHNLENKIENYEEKNQNTVKKNVLIAMKKLYKKLNLFYSGIKNMNKLPDIIILSEDNKIVVDEAFKCGITVIKICDTNSDPTRCKMIIPANNDSSRSLDLILTTIEEFAISGIKRSRISASNEKVQNDIKKVFNKPR